MRTNLPGQILLGGLLGLCLGLAVGVQTFVAAGGAFDPVSALKVTLPELYPLACVGLLLGIWMPLLRFRDFRPWQLPGRLRTGSAPWKRVREAFPTCLCLVVLLALPVGWSNSPALSLFAAALGGWTYLGYQVWQCEWNGGIERLHRFFGLQWSSRPARVVAQVDSDPFSSAKLSTRRSKLPQLEGFRSDEKALRRRRLRATLGGLLVLFALYLGLNSMVSPGTQSDSVLALVGLVPWSYLAYRLMFAALPAGVPRVELPQPRRRGQPLIECQAASSLAQVGCGVLFLLFGGFYFLAVLLAVPVYAMILVGQALNLSPVPFVAGMILALLASRVGPRQRTFFELELGSCQLWKHRVSEPYQFSSSPGQIVAFGLQGTAVSRALPVAYLSNGQHVVLTHRSFEVDFAWQQILRLATTMLVPAIPPSLSASPSQVCGWISSNSLQQKVHPWQQPKKSSQGDPGPQPPLD